LDFYFPLRTKGRINKPVNETTGNHFEVSDEREFSFLFELQIPSHKTRLVRFHLSNSNCGA